MNAPFVPSLAQVRLLDLADVSEIARLEAFVARHPEGTPFHRPAWFVPVARSTGNRAFALVQERAGEIVAFLPLNAIHSPVFGRLLASTGFAVGGGLLTIDGAEPPAMFLAAEEMARRLSCPSIELRGGALPQDNGGWAHKTGAHASFARPLASDDEAQLASIPRKQRAEFVARSVPISRSMSAHRKPIATRTTPCSARATAIWARPFFHGLYWKPCWTVLARMRTS